LDLVSLSLPTNSNLSEELFLDWSFPDLELDIDISAQGKNSVDTSGSLLMHIPLEGLRQHTHAICFGVGIGLDALWFWRW
jgi:hypothetical protein